MKGLARTVVVLGVVSFLTDVAADMAVPFLPLFLATQLHSGAQALGLIEGVAESTSSLMKFLVGVLSDRMPRKKPLVLLGYTVSNLARPLLALATAPRVPAPNCLRNPEDFVSGFHAELQQG